MGHVDKLADESKLPFLCDELVALVTNTQKFKALRNTSAAASSAPAAASVAAPTEEYSYPNFSEMHEVSGAESLNSSEAEVMSANCVCPNCTLPITIDNTPERAHKRKHSDCDARDSDDSSYDARHAPIEPAGIGQQKVMTTRDQKTLSRQRNKTGFEPMRKPAADPKSTPQGMRRLTRKTPESSVTLATATNAQADGAPTPPPDQPDPNAGPNVEDVLRGPFELIRRNPKQNRTGEAYVLQAPGVLRCQFWNPKLVITITFQTY